MRGQEGSLLTNSDPQRFCSEGPHDADSTSRNFTASFRQAALPLHNLSLRECAVSLGLRIPTGKLFDWEMHFS
jgi:hypothetical protein